jgi:hypothetical protein
MIKTAENIIRHRKTALTLNNFVNLQFGKVYPTDIDAFMEFSNKIFILIEGKQQGVELKGGQRYALERLCDKCDDEHSKSLLIVCENRYSNNEVDLGQSIVREYRSNRIWYNTQFEMTVRTMVDKFLLHCKRTA